MRDGAPPVICVDDRRVHWSRGTGAASYAQVLRQAIPRAGFTAESLVDAPNGPFIPPGRTWRWTAAMAPWRVATGAPVDGARMAKDVFRRAQVHFDIYGRYLQLRGPVRPALMHWSYTLPLHFAGVPNLYSVLDLIPLLQPELTPIDQTRAKRLLNQLRQEAAHLVTISETSRREIITALDWPADRVTNTYLAVDVPPPDPAQIQAACAAAGLQPDDYVLHVGTVERRKNIGRLVEGYRASFSTRALVLAGPDGWGAADEMSAAEGLLVTPGAEALAATGRPRVIRIDWMSRSELMSLMQGATAVLAPSLAEGFGMPVAEAMALGIPTLTSLGGAPAEIAGKATVLIDPLDVRAIAAGITALDRDPGLRATLSAAGWVRARAFTQEAYAARLAALYTDVLERAA